MDSYPVTGQRFRAIMRASAIDALVLMVVFGSSIAYADEKKPEGSSLVRGEQACIDDYYAYCSSAGLDRDAIHACFLAHKSKVSPACMTIVKNFK